MNAVNQMKFAAASQSYGAGSTGFQPNRQRFGQANPFASAEVAAQGNLLKPQHGGTDCALGNNLCISA